mmetsp:Transcript_65034/g.181857  ORF Transcript_65034/g.181857 Transcript_65034/m.181857 type:complete len:326 (-) Transcript_65034:9-986(-)
MSEVFEQVGAQVVVKAEEDRRAPTRFPGLHSLLRGTQMRDLELQVNVCRLQALVHGGKELLVSRLLRVVTLVGHPAHQNHHDRGPQIFQTHEGADLGLALKVVLVPHLDQGLDLTLCPHHPISCSGLELVLARRMILQICRCILLRRLIEAQALPQRAGHLRARHALHVVGPFCHSDLHPDAVGQHVDGLGVDQGYVEQRVVARDARLVAELEPAALAREDGEYALPNLVQKLSPCHVPELRAIEEGRVVQRPRLQNTCCEAFLQDVGWGLHEVCGVLRTLEHHDIVDAMGVVCDLCAQDRLVSTRAEPCPSPLRVRQQALLGHR